MMSTHIPYLLWHNNVKALIHGPELTSYILIFKSVHMNAVIECWGHMKAVDLDMPDTIPNDGPQVASAKS